MHNVVFRPLMVKLKLPIPVVDDHVQQFLHQLGQLEGIGRHFFQRRATTTFLFLRLRLLR